MPGAIEILGDGIAACCCARLLLERGFRVSATHEPRVGGPILLLNQSTQRLLLDVFGSAADLFAGAPQINMRVVKWGRAPAAELPHSGIVISEADLLRRLWKHVGVLSPIEQPDWRVYASAVGTPGETPSFGTRRASSARVQLRDNRSDKCWIESLDSGWLFLLPCGDGQASLLALGDASLQNSSLIASQIDIILPPDGKFPAYPRIRDPLCAPGWLACGSAAMSFDPICGEGAGNAVREAILASALIAAAQNGEPLEAILAHYSSRLLSGFLRHLDISLQFYSAPDGAWWNAELAEIERGIAWTRARLAVLPQPLYSLRDFDLVVRERV